MNRQVILQALSSMSDRELLDGFKAMVNSGAVNGHNDDIDFDAFAHEPDDPMNKPRGWSELAFEKGPDNRAPLSDRRFIIPKQERMRPSGGLGDTGMGQDDMSGAGDYNAFV